MELEFEAELCEREDFDILEPILCCGDVVVVVSLI